VFHWLIFLFLFLRNKMLSMLSFSYSTRYKRGGGIIRRTEQKRRKATEGYSDYSWFPRQHSIFYICYIHNKVYCNTTHVISPHVISRILYLIFLSPCHSARDINNLYVLVTSYVCITIELLRNKMVCLKTPKWFKKCPFSAFY
jgi:hypothetical protein